MGAGYGCGPEDEIRETELLDSQQNDLEEANFDDDGPSSREPEDFSGIEFPGAYTLTERYSPDSPSHRASRIQSGTYSEVDAAKAGLETLPKELIKLIFTPEVLPESRESSHSSGTKDLMFYSNGDLGDALEVETVPVNRFGDKARKGEEAVGFKITLKVDFNWSRTPELGAFIVFPATEAQVDLLHKLAWEMASVEGRRMVDSELIVNSLKSTAALMGVETHELLPRFPLNTDSSYERAFSEG